MFEHINFLWPWVFVLLPLPLLVALLLTKAKTQSSASLRFPYYAELQQQQKAGQRSRSWIKLVLAIITWMLLITAAARPQHVGEAIVMPVSSRSLMLAVDVSGSMQEKDMQLQGRWVDRLTAVKKVAGDFIDKREGDRVGLILFGEQAYLQTPLSLDRKTVHIFLEEAQIGLAGKSTAIGDAIGLAVKRLKEQEQDNRVLVLLTDGSNTSGNVDPLKAADLAAQESIKIYTIGVGGNGSNVRSVFAVGGRGEIDETTLQAISDKTGGRFFRANDTKSLESIYQLLDKIEPVSDETKHWRPVEERYRLPLAIAFILTLLSALVSVLPWLLSRLRKTTVVEAATDA